MRWCCRHVCGASASALLVNMRGTGNVLLLFLSRIAAINSALRRSKRGSDNAHGASPLRHAKKSPAAVGQSAVGHHQGEGHRVSKVSRSDFAKLVDDVGELIKAAGSTPECQGKRLALLQSV